MGDTEVALEFWSLEDSKERLTNVDHLMNHGQNFVSNTPVA